MSSIELSAYRRDAHPFDVRRWATDEEIACYSSGDPTRDLILAEGAGIDFAGADDFARRRNRNVIFLASSGAGKTYGGVLPQLINHHPGSYVVTDTKGELSRATAEGFERDGYEAVRLDTIDLARSACFNPFVYIRTEDDIPVVTRMVLDAISPNRGVTVDSFWNNSEGVCADGLVGILFDCEIINGCLAEGAAARGIHSPRYMTMRNLQRLLAMVHPPLEGGTVDLSPLDRMVEQLSEGEMEDPFNPGRKLVFEPMRDSLGVRQYHAFKAGAERTVRSIVISFQADLARVCTPEILRVLDRDDLRLDEIDERRRVIYLVMNDNDAANNIMGNLAVKMLLYVALKKADANPGGRLKMPVQFIADEFCNLGRLDSFERAISVMRSRDMGVTMCVQSLGQLDHVYGPNVRDIIMENCDSIVIMGTGSSLATAAFASELCGTTPIASERAGEEGTVVSVEERVITPTDVSRLPREQCIVKISGAKPYLARKYDVRRHPNAERFLNLD